MVKYPDLNVRLDEFVPATAMGEDSHGVYQRKLELDWDSLGGVHPGVQGGFGAAPIHAAAGKMDERPAKIPTSA